MKLVDSNVWLALVVGTHQHHAAASNWFAGQGPDQAIFCRPTQQSFLRLLTTRSVQNLYNRQPLTNREAYDLYLNLLVDQRVGFVQEPNSIDAHWQRLASIPSCSPKLWIDAYLAAFAIAGKHQLVTIDKAFAQFDGLDLVVLSS